jgi:DNA polymerase III alpha subunit (gram-positive type)
MYLCFIDTETTGIDPVKNGIIQIAGMIAKYENKELFTLDTFDYKVQPLHNDEINPEALKVTNTAEADLWKRELPTKVHKELITLFGNYCSKYDKADKMIMVAYNAIFDYNVLRAWFEKLGDKYFGSWFHFPPVDVMNMAAFDLMEVRRLLPNFKLGTVADYLSIKPDGDLHDALIDIELTKKLFEYFINKNNG